MRYTPPKPEDLQRLKRELDRTGEQMAELFGVAGGQQWRKYTGGAQPREMAPQVLFFGAARLALTDGEMERVIARMREIGPRLTSKCRIPATCSTGRPNRHSGQPSLAAPCHIRLQSLGTCRAAHLAQAWRAPPQVGAAHDLQRS